MRKENSGFSLVELIVVIAIMAVLVGVLAPAYLRYIEKSRKSTDVSAVDEMLKAADSVAADPQFDVMTGDYYCLKCSGGGLIEMLYFATSSTTSLTVYAASASDIAEEWRDVANIREEGYTLRSKEFRAEQGLAYGNIDASGAVVWELDARGSLFKDMCAYSTDLAKKLNRNVSSGS